MDKTDEEKALDLHKIHSENYNINPSAASLRRSPFLWHASWAA